MRIALGVEYLGSAFCGWQAQPGQRSVQQTLEQAVSMVANAPISVYAAGRTDTGVHAINQVVHFDTQATRHTQNWLLGINTHLPRDIAVTWVQSVDPAFHARFSAIKRRYRYLIWNQLAPSAIFDQRMWRVYGELDVPAMQAAANQLLGTHDFSAFRARECQAKSPIKTLDNIAITQRESVIVIEVEAKSFLHHMVRNLVGVLLPVGQRKASIEWVTGLLQSGDRSQAGITAPAHGLYLVDVDYPAGFAIPKPAKLPILW